MINLNQWSHVLRKINDESAINVNDIGITTKPSVKLLVIETNNKPVSQ